MIQLANDIKLDRTKIEKKLSKWMVNYLIIPIYISSGGWTLNVFGTFSKENGISTIRVFIPSWIPDLFELRETAASYIILHEWAHICGITECLNPDKKERKSCLMYENDKQPLKEISVLPLQLLRGLKFCSFCEKFLKNKKG